MMEMKRVNWRRCCLKTRFLVAIIEPSWKASFTPWTAPRLFKKGADFGGGAADYHADLIHKIIPEIERECGFQAAWRGLLGYSLAGLFTLYCAMISPYFQYIASVSGSLWFDDFMDFVAQQSPPNMPIYVSLGDGEAAGKNPRTAAVQIATEKIVSHWQAAGVNVFFELNAGGHFDDVAQRVAKTVKHFTALQHTV
ncbi:alpha/beta hydrolase-fold protein [Neisseriaceae bacterium B1]